MVLVENSKISSQQEGVAAIGFFDGVHKGHQYLIKQVKDEAIKEGKFSSILTFPQHPAKVMNPSVQLRLLTTYEEKVERIRSSAVDYCIALPFTKELSKLTAYEFMKLLRDHYQITTLLVGYDNRFGHGRKEGFEDYCRYGVELGIKVVQAASFHLGKSELGSSLIRKEIEKGNVEYAAELLGYNFFGTGVVVDGKKLGRTIGYPTANIALKDEEKLVPGFGVYAVWGYVNGQKYGGMLNIGCRPTVAEGLSRTIEVNLFDFNENIYGKELTLEYVKRIRDEIKFDGLTPLIKQLGSDEEVSRKILKL